MPRRDGEAARIFANAARNVSLNAEDTRYLGQLIAERTGLSAADRAAAQPCPARFTHTPCLRILR